MSFHYAARIWREEDLKAHRSGTFKLSKDPAFAQKVADVVALYLQPSGGGVVLSIDEKTQIQALDQTQPVLPVTFAAPEKRTHDYVRHGTTNLFAALSTVTGEVVGECRPTRGGADFLAFLKKAEAARGQGDPCRPGQPLHAHHPGSQGVAGQEPARPFRVRLVGSPWLNRIEIWFCILTRQSILRGTFSSVHVLTKLIYDCDRRRDPREGLRRPGQSEETHQ